MRTKYLSNWSSFTALAFALGAVTGCATEEIETNSVEPGWALNQEFHLETVYKKSASHTARGDVTADPAADDLGDTLDLVDSRWSEPVYWRYQVIEQGLRPEAGDDFYEYAVKGGTESALTVIKGSLAPSLNLDSEVADADPKIYMVIREDRLRMAGMVAFWTVNGERLSSALTLDDDAMNRSYNLLSQSNMSIIPHSLPPFPIAKENKDLVLEDGQRVTFSGASLSSVDAVYTNMVDETVIADTWEDGQPWATRSVSDNVESRLMSTDEVSDMAGPLGGTFDNDDDEDFDYIARLKESVNISATMNINDMIGTNTHSAREGFEPWAGSWWRQSEAALVFGHLSSTNDTLSELRKEQFKTPAVEMQNIGDDLRDLRKAGNGEGDEYREKVDEYKAKQEALVDELVGFYSAIQSGIDGGNIRIENGRISAEANWNNDEDNAYPAFDFEINKLSPLDKFALLQQVEGHTQGTNPWFGPAWELLNHWSPAGSSWFGHCNGWAAAAILTHEPRDATTYNFGSANQHAMELGVGDQKGLLSETYYSQLSNFYGARYNGDEGEDIGDLSPKAVLNLLATYVKERGVPLVFDTSANEEVWNFPAYSYTMSLTETTAGGAAASSGLININTAGMEELKTLWGISDVRAERIIQYREQVGPFQNTEDIVNVSGIGFGIFERIKEQITVDASTDLRGFDGQFVVRFATDGVGYSHVDSDPHSPQGFTKTWAFTLEASPAGEVINGSWKTEGENPDFAWVPYVNTVRSGRSENPYLMWNNLQDYLGDELVRE